jgi:hypothetical protein
MPSIKSEFEDAPTIKTEFEEPEPEQPAHNVAPLVEYHSSSPLIENGLYHSELDRPIVSVPEIAAAGANLTEPGQYWRLFPPHTYTTHPAHTGDSSRNLDPKRQNAVAPIVAAVRMLDVDSTGPTTASEKPQHSLGRSPAPPPLVSHTQNRLEEDEDANLNKLRPSSRDFGGSQILISQEHALQSLIAEAGGYSNLQLLVKDMNALQRELNKGKHMDDISSFITEVRCLRSKEQHYTALNSIVEGPHGLRLDALRYKTQKQKLGAIKQAIDNLKQQLDEICSDTMQQNGSPSRRAPTDTPLGICNDSIPDCRNSIKHRSATNDFADMNPARVHLISSLCPREDPNRDLYEAERPALQWQTTTGSNGIPLGIPQPNKAMAPLSQTAKGVIWKRKEPEGLLDHAEKRLRSGNRSIPKPTPSSLIGDAAVPSLDSSTQQGWEEFIRNISSTVEILRGQPQISSDERSQNQTLSADGRLTSFSHVPSTTGTAKSLPNPGGDGDGLSTRMILSLPRILLRNATGDSEPYPFAPYPTAFWISGQVDVPTWGDKEFKTLKAGFQMPAELYVHMLAELAHYVNTKNTLCWDKMPIDGHQCIIR